MSIISVQLLYIMIYISLSLSIFLIAYHDRVKFIIIKRQINSKVHSILLALVVGDSRVFSENGGESVSDFRLWLRTDVAQTRVSRLTRHT